MTVSTITQFTPSASQAFSFQPTLDGSLYTITVTWNLFGQRYYVNCYTTTGTLVFSLPLIGSPASIPIECIQWTSGIAYVALTQPHGLPKGSVADLTLIQCSPSVYNDSWAAFVDGPASFQIYLSSDPGGLQQAGYVENNINLAGGYFSTSSLVYRDLSQQFEVTP